VPELDPLAGAAIAMFGAWAKGPSEKNNQPAPKTAGVAGLFADSRSSSGLTMLYRGRKPRDTAI
jgi:hypothetical protein